MKFTEFRKEDIANFQALARMDFADLKGWISNGPAATAERQLSNGDESVRAVAEPSVLTSGATTPANEGLIPSGSSK